MDFRHPLLVAYLENGLGSMDCSLGGRIQPVRGRSRVLGMLLTCLSLTAVQTQANAFETRLGPGGSGGNPEPLSTSLIATSGSDSAESKKYSYSNLGSEHSPACRCRHNPYLEDLAPVRSDGYFGQGYLTWYDKSFMGIYGHHCPELFPPLAFDLWDVPETTTKADPEGGELPDYIGDFYEPIEPGRLTYLSQRLAGINLTRKSNRPTVDMPDGVYFELMRPLSSLAYDTEVNYLTGDYVGDPAFHTPQLMEIEIAVADWHSAEFAMEWTDGDPTFFLFGYQPTFGVGPEENWVHGANIYVPYIYNETNIMGAVATYIFGWKPHKDHPFSTLLFVGFDTQPVEQQFDVDALGNRTPGTRLGEVGPRRGEGEAEYKAVWRPVLNSHFFYETHKNFWVGIENNFRYDDDHPHYIVLPQAIWHFAEHVEVRAGAGYYRSGDAEGTALLVRTVFETSSHRIPSTKHDPGADYGHQAVGSTLARWYDAVYETLTF